MSETIINVTEIEPKLKHPTIFNVFDGLEPGGSFVIHNDHDPKPVYYQLLGERGEIFTWEYLEKGPEWWDVRVTLKGGEKAQASEMASKNVSTTTSSKKEDVVIDVPKIEPKLKHPTIFNVFDSLGPGESLIIHNDHDPKPVYYQLLGERGEVFYWEYLEKGPEVWNIRVTKKGGEEPKETIGQITAKDLRKAEVFKKFGIDYCCGGKKTVKEACEEKGIDPELVEKELQQPIVNVTSTTLNFGEWNPDFLADYIVNTHHNYVRKYLPEIRGYATKVAQVHGSRHPELAPIRQLVEDANAELSSHIEEEENKLFPLIKKIALAKKTKTTYFRNDENNFAKLVETTEAEHESVGDIFDKIRVISKDFALPEDACASYKLFYQMLDEFENDLHTHIHLENNVLFPKVIEMEKTLI